MLNRMQIEGVVLKTWKYASTPFARLVNRPDPGLNQEDMLFIARLPATVPMAVGPGDQLRMHGRFYNRRQDDSEGFIGEIHAEQVVLIARNQLRRPRSTDDAGDSDESEAIPATEAVPA